MSRAMEPLSDLQAEICALAMKGVTPAQIEQRMGERVTRGTINRALRKGRRHGMAIPVFVKGKRLKQVIEHNYHTSKPKAEPKPEKAGPPPLTIEEKAQIAYWTIERGLGVESIGTLLRKPYSVITAEIDRQKLSRAG